MIIKKRKGYLLNSSGFTLLEMIVSLGIFMIIAVIAVGSLVRITSLNRQAQSLQSAMNNVNYALESISREMRIGYHFHCGTEATFANSTLTAQACPANPTVIAFNSSIQGTNRVDGGSCQLLFAYWFIDDSIKKAQQAYCDDNVTRVVNGVPNEVIATDIIDTANVKIDSYTLGVTTGAQGYSWATIRLIGHSGIKENEKNNFDVRTGIAQRIEDF